MDDFTISYVTKKMIKLAFARKGQDDRTKTQNVLLK